VLIQQNINASNAFNRSWAEYKVGFNDSNGHYWLGNDLLSQLTTIPRYHSLRIDVLYRHDWNWYYHVYSMVRVLPESQNNELRVAGYTSSHSGDALRRAGGSNYMMFTTYDRDNDKWSSGNCAEYYGGGFWYSDCGYALLNNKHNNVWGGNDVHTSRMWLQCG